MSTLARSQWKAMIRDTILKELRSKTLVFIFIASTLLIFLAHAILKMMVENKDAATSIMITGDNSLTIMFNIINFWSVIIAGIFGISAIRSDLKSNIIYQYLTFPMSRTKYVASRILGAWILVYSYYLYSYLLSAILFSVATKTMALHPEHLLSMLLMGLYVLLIIILSVPLSLIAGKIGAFLLLFVTVFTISVSSNMARALEFKEYFKNIGIFKIFGLLVYFLLPRVNYVSELASNVMSHEKVQFNIAFEALHLVLSTLLLLYVVDLFFKRKNF